MKKQKKLNFLLLLIILGTFLSGCNFLGNEIGKMEEALKGRDVIVQTYDENSNIIDRIEGSSVSMLPDGKFDLTDSEFLLQMWTNQLAF